MPVDATPGAVLETFHRSPATLLAGILETDNQNRSALAQALDSAAEGQSVGTPAALFADPAQLATAGRTASWLDQLVSDGHLSADERVAIAAKTLTGLPDPTSHFEE